MVKRDSRRRLRTIAASAAVVGALSLVGVAGPATAATARPSPGICVRAERQWDRLVAANQQAKTAFARAQALQNRLIRTGRVVVAHRLDTRLAHLRAVHAALVARVQVIATRVRGRCAARAPTLTGV